MKKQTSHIDTTWLRKMTIQESLICGKTIQVYSNFPSLFEKNKDREDYQ